MNRNAILGALVALFVGLWGGAVLGRIGGGTGPIPSILAASGPEKMRAADAPRAGEGHYDGMQFVRLRLDTTSEQPKACLEFSQDLSTDPNVRYSDYLEITPAAQVSTTAVGNQLCLGGLSFEPDHQVTIRQGLPGKSGQRTEDDEQITVAFGDRPAFVGFSGNGVILPRTDADGLAIETVNVSKLKIQVLRVSDRILTRENVDVGQAIAEGSYDWWNFENAGSDSGTPVYEGTLDIKIKDAKGDHHNETLTTVFPLGAALKEFKPGAYIVKVQDASPSAGANGDNDNPAAAHRWIIYTDMALQTFEGAGGMDVVVRSLATAKPMSGVTMTLIASNNDVLGQVRADGDGRVRFPAALMKGEGALRARYVMAYGPKGDFTALDLQRPTLDLSDRDVDGRGMPGDVDAFMYSDRGIYRPGEVVRVAGLLRDSAGRAIANRQSTLVIYRPNGTEARRDRLDLAKDAGAIIKNVWLDKNAPRGVWRAALLVDGQDSEAGSLSFSVEDFVPQRLAVTAEVKDKRPMHPGDTRPIHVDAQFLYGAPGAGLSVEGEVRLQVEPNPFPTENKNGFSFGRESENFEEKFIQLTPTLTDGQGQADLAFSLTDVPDSSLPLRAKGVATVFEPGGRTVRKPFELPVRLSDVYIGVKPAFDADHVDEGGSAAFEIIAVNGAGQRVAAKGVTWQLVHEDWSYDWYNEYGQWKWRRTGRDIPVAGGNGRIDTGAQPIKIAHGGMREGSYRLVVKDAAGQAETTYRFYAGWSWGAGGDENATPDMVTVVPPPTGVKPGASVHVEIKPPYAGEAQIVVATDRVLSMKTIRVSDKGGSIDLRADKEWGAGAYVLVTVMTPRSPTALPIPRRAVGVAYVPVDTSSREIKLDLAKGLDKIKPRQRVTIPIVITGAPRGEKVRMTLAAVDEGILQLTDFKSPDPRAWYFGRKALGVGIRDDYGRLLDPNKGAPSMPRQGGDSLGGEGLTVVPTKTVALWSGLVTIDSSGRANIPLDIPDFNGQLRLMAVAWSETGVGSASKPLIVRDPVVAELTLPRFLAPGDDAFATLELNNVEGGAGAYAVTVSGVGAAAVQPYRQSFNLGQGQQQRVRVPVSGAAAGIGKVSMTISGPGGFSVTRSYDIQTRTPFMPVTEVTTAEQRAGETYSVPPAVLAAYAPGEGKAVISYSNLRGLDPAPLLDVLWRYPYGCSEQLTSTSMPLLYANELAGATGGKLDKRLAQRLQESVNKLLDRQGTDGSFGLWREGDRSASPWLGAYVVDFLSRAKAAGIVVPNAPMELAYKGLRAVAKLNDFSNVSYDFEVYKWPGSNDSKELLRSRAAAYALYVLARAGKVDVGQVRYFHDAKLKDEPSPLARAQIGAALAHLGDRARARDAFAKAAQALGYRNTGDYYQSPLRDLAGVLALAAEAGQTDLVNRLAVRLEREQPDADYLMTQEQAQLLMASHALLKRAGPVSVSLNGGAAGAIKPTNADIAAIARGLAFRNAGKGPVWRTITTSGAPREAPPGAARGFSLSKSYYTIDGAPVNLADVKQGQRVIVVLSGAPEGQREHQAVLVDLLPAGLEIESILKPEDGAAYGDTYSDSGRRDGPFAWAGRISYGMVTEARDDRFVAAMSVRGEAFKYGYIARAVTAGAFTAPGAQIEDMYRPGVYGRTDAGKIQISQGQ